MGDVGSGWLGLTVAVLLLAAAAEGGVNAWAGLILIGAFAADATTTLLRRLLRGERVYEAHRSHAYQWAARRLGSHRTVTLATIAIDLAWLLPWGAYAARHPQSGALAALAAIGPLVVLCLALGAGRPEARR
jgi:Fuc2NAc and GlcNAc transferase